MIFVSLGTQDKTFERLLQAVEKQVEAGLIQEEVIVQAGKTKFTSKHMEIHSFVDETMMNTWIKDCRILITHGGVGTILSALRKGKTMIAAARLAKYKEHTNDHQLQIIENFSKAGYLLELRDFDCLGEVLKEAETFQPNAFESNTTNMIALIKQYIES